MADIHVERKSPSVWPWILGVAVAALLAWALIGMFTGGDEEVQLVEPVSEVGPNPEVAPPLDTMNAPTGAP